MSAESWAFYLTLLLDLLGVGALIATQEIHSGVTITLLIVFVLSRFRPLRLRERHVFALLILLLLGAIGAWLGLKIPPILSAAHFAPLAHASIWMAPEQARYRGWRIGLGFVQLILASALTAQFYLSVAIFIFVLTASIAVSCGYLDQQLREKAPNLCGEPLPRGFIRRSFGIALVISLLSAVIFPLLPRVNQNGTGGGGTQVGYTEEVSISSWKQLAPGDGGTAVLRLFSEDDADLLPEFYLGLLRGRALEIFDGGSWIPMPETGVRSQLDRDPLLKKRGGGKKLLIEAMREPLNSEALPVPYGTSRVFAGSSAQSTMFRSARLGSGDWSEPGSRSRRFSYRFELERFDPRESQFRDEPLRVHTALPKRKFDADRFNHLAKKIFGKRVAGATRTAEGTKTKVDALLNWFRKENFQVLTGNEPDNASHAASEALTFTPLERFLFVERKGHCEWFASAAAILLRLEGIPTRLIAGFRITSPSLGGVITIRTGDAHAWLEYWQPERGWMPLDPTPRIQRGLGPLAYFRDAYDLVENYWYRFIMTEGDQSLLVSWITGGAGFHELFGAVARWVQSNRERMVWGALAGILVGALVGILVWVCFPWMFSIRWKVREGPWRLRIERTRMELLLLRARSLQRESSSPWRAAIDSLGARFGENASQALRDWLETYQRARFGREGELGVAMALPHLAVLRRELGQKLRKK